jgi:outer membrane lipoprotein-sorting protein
VRQRLTGLLIVLALSLVARAEEPAFVKKVEAAMGKVKTTRGRFKQTKTLALFDDKVESEGSFAIGRPDRLRWEVEKPFRSILVIAGDKGARWNETRKEVERFSLADKPGIDIAVRQLFTWYSGRYEEVSGQFDVSADEGARAIAMTPKNDKVREVVSKITIKLSSSLETIDSIVLDEKGGDATAIVFEGVETNRELAKDLFEITGK